MYEEQFGHTVIEEVVEKDGIEFTLTRGSPPSISTFEQALDEIKSVYEAQFGHSVAEEVVEKDICRQIICQLCFLTWRQAPTLWRSLEAAIGEAVNARSASATDPVRRKA